jgi:nitric-oxide synthase
MCTEIGSRDLGDTCRYDQLPVIAAHMGLCLASDRSLWKDTALTELNVAVLHSFGTAGVTISDHHTESARFLEHVEREERHGRACPADWTWIVPPATSSATPVFHRYYQDFDQTPNFYRHPAPARHQPVGRPLYEESDSGASRGSGPSRATIGRDGSRARGGADDAARGGETDVAMPPAGISQQAGSLRDTPWLARPPGCRVTEQAGLADS